MSEQAKNRIVDPFSARQSSSHKRVTESSWDALYHDGLASLDIGRPQPAIARLASEGGFSGTVLDVGCGTGENALYIASLGLSVLGIDMSSTALAMAQGKADDRGIEIEFTETDALQLELLGCKFETVLDCGLFHTLDVYERPEYLMSLSAVTALDAKLYLLCFSDTGSDLGPHPVYREELNELFNPSNGWNVIAIEPNRLLTQFHEQGTPAWLATIKRSY
jgi:SAM-dependent methyltransferase